MSGSVSELLHARTSIRAFLDEPVERATVEGMIEDARFSPSGGNLQPWKLIVVAGKEKEAISKLALETLMANPGGEADEFPIYPANLREPYRSRRFDLGEQMYSLLEIPREDKAARLQWVSGNFGFWGAPVGIFFAIDRRMGHGQWTHLGMFMQSLALLATERGLSSCFQEAWAMLRKTLHAHLEVPADEVIYCGMALGHADSEHPVNALRSKRAPVTEIAEFRGF